nr:hypothetical protein [Paludibacter sp.]
MIKESLRKLIEYVECQQYKGYDPYDTLNSWFPFHWFGKWGPPIVTQIQKRNPINLRPIMGIKKGVNPKAMGVFLKAYSLLYKKNGDRTYREKADYFFNWLKQNSSKGYSGHCWGSNFHWANPGRYLQAYIPSVVVTSFVVDGIYSYYKATGNIEAVELIKSAAKYIVNDIPISRMPKG